MGKVISIVNQKGGVAKTTTCVSLGVGLAKHGKKVLLIDADPQGSLTQSLGYQDMDNNSCVIADLMKRVINDEDFPEDMHILHSEEGVDLIPGNIELADMELVLVTTMSREFVMKQVIEEVRDQYDYILIDNTPSLGMITINTLAASDEVLIPAEATYLSIKGLQMLFRTIAKVRKQINRSLRINGILFTLVDSRTKEAKDNMQEVREAYGKNVYIYESAIPVSVKAKECSREGVSILKYDPRGKVTKAYEAFTGEVLNNG